MVKQYKTNGHTESQSFVCFGNVSASSYILAYKVWLREKKRCILHNKYSQLFFFPLLSTVFLSLIVVMYLILMLLLLTMMSNQSFVLSWAWQSVLFPSSNLIFHSNNSLVKTEITVVESIGTNSRPGEKKAANPAPLRVTWKATGCTGTSGGVRPPRGTKVYNCGRNNPFRGMIYALAHIQMNFKAVATGSNYFPQNCRYY